MLLTTSFVSLKSNKNAFFKIWKLVEIHTVGKVIGSELLLGRVSMHTAVSDVPFLFAESTLHPLYSWMRLTRSVRLVSREAPEVGTMSRCCIFIYSDVCIHSSLFTYMQYRKFSALKLLKLEKTFAHTAGLLLP